ncbi:MAG: hypothetical protein QXX99_00090 [Candidatus Bathyarchaeia archaeon]
MGLDIHGFEGRLEGYRRIIAGFGHNDEVTLRFLDHLFSLGLSVARVCKYADHAIALLRVIDFELEKATKRDVERIVAWINRQPYKEWTKHGRNLYSLSVRVKGFRQKVYFCVAFLIASMA